MAKMEDLSYLDENLTGPILKIEDPYRYSKEDILKSYYREIVLIAGKFTRPNISKVDLVSEGIAGLLDAIERWDPEKANGNPRNFHNLAIVRIKDAMYKYFLQSSGRYKFSSNMARGLNYLDRVRRAIDDSGYPGNVDEVVQVWEHEDFNRWASADCIDKVKAQKQKIRKLAESTNQEYESTVAKILVAERNTSQHEQGEDLDERDPEKIAADREFLNTILKSLQPETRDIITMSLEGRTLEEIGQAQGKSRQRIEQIRSEFLDIMKKTRMYKSIAGK